MQYARLAKSALFQSGLDRVLQGAARYCLALMCAEKEPLECHRTLLVAKALVARGQPVLHIHADGHLETQEAAMERFRPPATRTDPRLSKRLASHKAPRLAKRSKPGAGMRNVSRR